MVASSNGLDTAPSAPAKRRGLFRIGGQENDSRTVFLDRVTGDVGAGRSVHRLMSTSQLRPVLFGDRKAPAMSHGAAHDITAGFAEDSSAPWRARLVFDNQDPKIGYFRHGNPRAPAACCLFVSASGRNARIPIGSPPTARISGMHAEAPRRAIT
jgi:hypothetical protein